MAIPQIGIAILSYAHLRAVLFEPLLPRFVFRHLRLNQLPESRRMVEFAKVAQFVNNHIIERLGRRLNQLPVEIQIAF